jgi:hypothetical protein
MYLLAANDWGNGHRTCTPQYRTVVAGSPGVTADSRVEGGGAWRPVTHDGAGRNAAPERLIVPRYVRLVWSGLVWSGLVWSGLSASESPPGIGSAVVSRQWRACTPVVSARGRRIGTSTAYGSSGCALVRGTCIKCARYHGPAWPSSSTFRPARLLTVAL